MGRQALVYAGAVLIVVLIVWALQMTEHQVPVLSWLSKNLLPR